MPKKKSEFIISLEKELEKHWEDTKEEREKTHTSTLILDFKGEVPGPIKKRKSTKKRL